MIDVMKELIKVIAIMISFIGVLILAYITTRIIGARYARYGYGQFIKIIDRIILGKDKWICLVQVGKNYYVIGVSNRNIELIGQISQEDLVPLERKKDDLYFSNILDKYINRWFGDRTDGHE